ncbi:MAG: hypothetical protein MUO27_11365 [Sedimentisphaerales bacterium]|nr:hypothetical protein [Sedimentisphaerales bacterium]
MAINEPNKQFLLDIAKEVEKLLVNSENRKVFELYGREFQKELAEYQKKVNEQRKFSSSDKSNPVSKLIPCIFGGIPPKNNKEEIEKSYCLLIIIHDWLLKSCVPINKDICTPSLAGLVGCLDFDLTDEEQIIIETALERVRADITQTDTKKTGENMNSANISLKSLSGKIRRYLSGEDVPDEPVSLNSMKNRLDILSHGLSDSDYESAYKNTRNLALELKQEHPGLPKLPPCNSNPHTGLQDLLEWCSDTGHLQQQADLGKLKPTERITSMIMVKSRQENWEDIKKEYDISKQDFGKKINFVKDPFKRKVIFRDVEDAFVLAGGGFPKAAIILAGGVIEELLMLYLAHKNVQAERDDFFHYIKACEEKKPPLLKSGISKLSDSVREWRNLVHLSIEEPKRHTISKATAKGAVSSIFIIANDFQ